MKIMVYLHCTCILSNRWIDFYRLFLLASACIKLKHTCHNFISLLGLLPPECCHCKATWARSLRCFRLGMGDIAKVHTSIFWNLIGSKKVGEKVTRLTWCQQRDWPCGKVAVMSEMQISNYRPSQTNLHISVILKAFFRCKNEREKIPENDKKSWIIPNNWSFPLEFSNRICDDHMGCCF